jgi:DUF2934 family protein
MVLPKQAAYADRFALGRLASPRRLQERSPIMPKTARSKNIAEEGPASPPPAEETASTEAEPSLEAIAERAYEIYKARGGVHGKDSDDWLEAELELRATRK